MRYFILFLGLWFTSNLAAQLHPNLVAYYSFDDCTARDSLDSIAGGEMFGNPGCVCGVSGNALSFDGIDDRIIFIGNVNNYFGTRNFTISFYFKVLGGGNIPMDILSYRDDCTANNAFGFNYTHSNRFVNVSISENTSKSNSMSANADFTNCWQHAVVVREAGKARLFLNGQLVSESQTVSRVDLLNNVLSIADSPCNASPTVVRFRGYIDELKVFDKAMLPEEIEEEYLMPDFIATNDTIVFLGSSIETYITGTCADQFEWIADNPNGGIQDKTASNTTLIPEQTTSYRLSFAHPDGCIAYDTLRVTVIDPAELGCEEIFLPRAFTPNNDQLNDEYGISNPYIIQNLVSFEIFDRWGSRVFMTDNAFEKWDGNFRGEPMNPGILLYKVKYTCDGEEKTNVGSLSLIR